MFSIIKSFLHGSIAGADAARILQKPDDLQVGDIITFQLLPQEMLSGKNFGVTAINSLDFKQGKTTLFTLQGESSQLIQLAECAQRGEGYISIRQQINRAMVDKLFGLENFSYVLDEGQYQNIATISKPETLDGWLADNYYKEIDCRKGYSHEGDYRNRPLPRFEDESLGFDYYLLLDKTETFGVEIEVRDNGESNIYVTMYQPASAIESLWPGK